MTENGEKEKSEAKKTTLCCNFKVKEKGLKTEGRRSRYTPFRRTLFSREATVMDCTVKGSLVKIPGSLFGEDQVTTLKRRSLSL